jgi:MFS family permease
MVEEKKRENETMDKIKGLGSAWWFALFCTLLVGGILDNFGYRKAMVILGPAVFLAILIPVLLKHEEFRKANRDEMFDFAYGKICVRIVNSIVWIFFPLTIVLYSFPEIPAYIALPFVGALIYGANFFLYYRWINEGGKKK